jgi:hypothetical protein
LQWTIEILGIIKFFNLRACGERLEGVFSFQEREHMAQQKEEGKVAKDRPRNLSRV